MAAWETSGALRLHYLGLTSHEGCDMLPRENHMTSQMIGDD
jgi:hypothetical protein